MRASDALASSPLWRFATTHYAREGVKPAALALQDTGLDVPLAFWICWAVSEGRDPMPRLEEARTISARWNLDVVHPLRGARNVLKTPPDFADTALARALRQQILDAELDGEAIVLGALEALDLPALETGASRRSEAFDCLRACRGGPGADTPLQGFIEAIFSDGKKE